MPLKDSVHIPKKVLHVPKEIVHYGTVLLQEIKEKKK